ncbi:MAG: fatty acid desaturase [Woeseiaceae bacterium]
MTKKHPNLEINLEQRLRKIKYLIPFATLVTAGLLIWAIYLLMKIFVEGHYWACIPAGFLAHSYLIICLHDGIHKSITRTWIDRIFANISAALLFLPFGELYRKYHLIHHRNTNLDNDPISPPVLRKLYLKNRYLYMLCEAIPLLYTFYLVMNYQKSENKGAPAKEISISYAYLISSLFVSVLWFILIKPSVWFIILTLFSFNIVSVFRNWCEHMGTNPDKSSNTYWFPLGFGIGHHDLHHQKPYLSWLTLTIGLFNHKKDTNPFKAFFGILFDKSFSFYTKK